MHVLRAAIFLFCAVSPALLFTTGISAQDRLRLVRADLLTNKEIQGETVRYLSGSVVLKQGDDTLYSDRVSNFTARRQWIFEGAVRVVDPEKTLLADYIRYEETENIFYLRGNLLLMQSDANLFADRAVYYPGKKTYSCAGHVRYVRGGTSMRSDSADFFEDKDVVEAHGSVRYKNERDNIQLNGAYGRFSSPDEYGMVYGNPSISFTDSASGEMTWIYGETMEYFGADRSVRIRENVRVNRGSLSAVSDTAWYYRESRTAVLVGGPEIHEKNNTITGKTVSLFFDGEKIQKLFVEGDAKATMPPDSGAGPDAMNELGGSAITIDFKGNDIDRMTAERNAVCRYYVVENGRNQGANVVSGTSITLAFSDGEIRKVLVEGGSEGLFYPPALDPRARRNENGSGQ